jgi:PAS domain S-box-containing protein
LKDLDRKPPTWGQKAERMKRADNYIGTGTETPLMPEIAKDLPAEAAPDALNIVIDAVNSSLEGMIITDLDGKIRFANAAFCKMFEYSSTQVMGKHAIDLFVGKEIRNFADLITIVDISKDDTVELTVKSGENRKFVVEVAASSVTSGSGDVVGRMASFVDITRRKEIEAEKDSLIIKLHDALRRIRTLRGIIPICAACKKIRDDQGIWNQIESYIRDHSDADFSHSICPECSRKLYPEIHQ